MNHRKLATQAAKRMAVSKRPKVTARALFNHWRAIVRGNK